MARGPIPTSGHGRRALINSHKASTAGLLMRDMLVWELHLQGLSEKAIASQDGRSGAVVGKIIRRFQAQGFDGENLLRQAPAKIIDGLVRRSIMAWRYAARTATDADSTRDRIAAIKAMLDADERVLSILQSTGYLPQELGTMHHLIDVRAIAVEMIDAVRALENGSQDTAAGPGDLRGPAGADRRRDHPADRNDRQRRGVNRNV